MVNSLISTSAEWVFHLMMDTEEWAPLKGCPAVVNAHRQTSDDWLLPPQNSWSICRMCSLHILLQLSVWCKLGSSLACLEGCCPCFSVPILLAIVSVLYKFSNVHTDRQRMANHRGKSINYHAQLELHCRHWNKSTFDCRIKALTPQEVEHKHSLAEEQKWFICLSHSLPRTIVMNMPAGSAFESLNDVPLPFCERRRSMGGKCASKQIIIIIDWQMHNRHEGSKVHSMRVPLLANN